GVLALVLLPEVDRRKRQAGLRVEKADQALGATQRRWPQLEVELVVCKLGVGSFEREERGSCLVDLDEAPARAQRALRRVPVQPQSFRVLRANEPQDDGDSQVGAVAYTEGQARDGEQLVLFGEVS